MKTLYAIVEGDRITQDAVHNQLRIFPTEHQAKSTLINLQANGTLQQRTRRKNYTVQQVEVTIEKVVTTRTELGVYLKPAVPATTASVFRDRYERLPW